MITFDDKWKFSMRPKIAKLHGIDDALELYFRYQVDSIKEKDKKDGFVTTAFTKEKLTNLINDEEGLFIMTDDEGKVIAYVMAASWQFWSIWPMFAHMIKDLPNLTYLGRKLSIENSYQQDKSSLLPSTQAKTRT